MQIIKDSKIDFINNSRFTILLSGALLLAGIFSLIINNGPKLSIDFKGGTLVAVQYTKPININNFRNELKTVTINGQKFDFNTGGAGRLNVTSAFKSEVIFLPPNLTFDLSPQQNSQTKNIQIESIDQEIYELDVKFPKSDYVKFEYELVI